MEKSKKSEERDFAAGAQSHSPRAQSLAKLSRLFGTPLSKRDYNPAMATEMLESEQWHSPMTGASLSSDCDHVQSQKQRLAQEIRPRSATPIERATTPKAPYLSLIGSPTGEEEQEELDLTMEKKASFSGMGSIDSPCRAASSQGSHTGQPFSPQSSISSMLSFSSSPSTSSIRLSTSSPTLSSLHLYDRSVDEWNPFPCCRADKCASSLLDETLGKYENHKYGVRLRIHSWKTRRITVNTIQVEKEEGCHSEEGYCLHSFKSSDLSCQEKERLVLDGASFVAVAESGRDWSGGEWVIKVSGTIVSLDTSSSSSSGSTKRPTGIRCQHGFWLLQYPSRERMQVWMRMLQSLIASVHKTEQAFRRGSQVTIEPCSPVCPSASLSLSLSPSPAPITSSTPPSQAYASSQPLSLYYDEEDSLEELVSSTESLLVFRPRMPYLSPVHSPSRASWTATTGTKRATIPVRPVTVQHSPPPPPLPSRDVLQQRGRSQSQASAFSLLPLDTLAAFPSPPSPSRKSDRCHKPVLPLRLLTTQEQCEEGFGQESDDFDVDYALQHSGHSSTSTFSSVSHHSSLSSFSSSSPVSTSSSSVKEEKKKKQEEVTLYGSKRSHRLELAKRSLILPLSTINPSKALLRPLDSPTDPEIIPTLYADLDGISLSTSSSEYSQESMIEEGEEDSENSSYSILLPFKHPIPLPSWCSNSGDASLDASLHYRA